MTSHHRFNNDSIWHIYTRGVERRDGFIRTADYLRFVVNLYEFNGNDNVRINSIDAREDYLLELEKNILVVSSGRRTKSSGEIHKLEEAYENEKIINLHDIKDIATEIEFTTLPNSSIW